MGTRKKVVGKEIKKVKFCDRCLRDLNTRKNGHGSNLIRCTVCKREICYDCKAKTSQRLCKECAGLCKGCETYSIQEILNLGLDHCPECGFIIEKGY
jgi:hypothetical protein